MYKRQLPYMLKQKLITEEKENGKIIYQMCIRDRDTSVRRDGKPLEKIPRASLGDSLHLHR